jgi:predicted nucleotidyltransferase
MRWAEPLDDILGSRAKIRLLRILAQSEFPLSGRAAARHARLSHAGAISAIKELEESRIVLPSSDGSGIRFRLNRHHILVRRILGLFETEAGLDDRLAHEITGLIPGTRSITVFGSVARGEDAAASDIDVLVIVEDGIDQDEAFDTLATLDSSLRLGKDLGPVVWTTSTLMLRNSEMSPLLQRVLAEGRSIFGPSIAELLMTRAGIDAG